MIRRSEWQLDDQFAANRYAELIRQQRALTSLMAPKSGRLFSVFSSPIVFAFERLLWPTAAVPPAPTVYFGRESMTRLALPIERSMEPTALISTRVEMPT